jgi:ribonuclease T2
MARFFMIRFVAGLALAVSLLAAASAPASAQDARQNEPGQFDFYVLSLSWSPSFCAEAQDRGRSGGAQCGARPYASGLRAAFD